MPTPLDIIGADAYTRSGARKAWSQANGYVTVYTYKGPAAKLTAFFLSIVGTDAIDIAEIDISEGIATVQVTYEDDDGSGGGGASNYNVTWELIGQDIYKDLRTFDGTILGTQSFNLDADQQELETVRKKYLEGKIDDAFVAALGAAATVYAKLLLRGTSEYVRSQVILRKTVKVGRRSLIEASWDGVDQAWKLSGELGSPDITGIGTAALLGTISKMPEADDTLKQWLKRAPQIRQIGGNKFSIAQDWWYARHWSLNLYLGDAAAGNP